MKRSLLWLIMINVASCAIAPVPRRYFYLPRLPHEVQMRPLRDFPEASATLQAEASGPIPSAVLPDVGTGFANIVGKPIMNDPISNAITGNTMQSPILAGAERTSFWPRQARRLTPLILFCSLSSKCTKGAAAPLLAASYFSFYLPSSPRRWRLPKPLRNSRVQDGSKMLQTLLNVRA